MQKLLTTLLQISYGFFLERKPFGSGGRTVGNL